MLKALCTGRITSGRITITDAETFETVLHAFVGNEEIDAMIAEKQVCDELEQMWLDCKDNENMRCEVY